MVTLCSGSALNAGLTNLPAFAIFQNSLTTCYYYYYYYYHHYYWMFAGRALLLVSEWLWNVVLGGGWCSRSSHGVTERSSVSGDIECDETLPYSAGRHSIYSLWGKWFFCAFVSLSLADFASISHRLCSVPRTLSMLLPANSGGKIIIRWKCGSLFYSVTWKSGTNLPHDFASKGTPLVDKSQSRCIPATVIFAVIQLWLCRWGWRGQIWYCGWEVPQMRLLGFTY